MIEAIAIILIILGIFIVLKGLREDYGYHIEEYEKRREEEREVKKEVKAGGVILIGPIPIVFGDSKYATLALVLTIILMLLVFAFLFGMQR